MLKLDIQKRAEDTNNDLARTEGLVPAVYYGRKTESTPILLTEKDFVKVWHEAGESTVISLVDGEEKIQALIKDVQTDPVSEKPVHVDFYVFEKGQKLEVSVPLEFVGTSPAVKDLGGLLIKVLHELEIKAEPKDLPHQIEVDISVLKEFGDQVLIKDLSIPEGVEVMLEEDEVVAVAEEPREEEPEEPEEEMDVSDIEVEKKGKEEDTEAEALEKQEAGDNEGQ